jgi:predicted RNA binding protein YcfA (HicA-like mRNA interferase family)
LSADEVIRILYQFGFKQVRQSGSHIHLWNEDRRRLVTVPNHAEIAKGTLLSILKQADIEKSEFLKKLRT